MPFLTSVRFVVLSLPYQLQTLIEDASSNAKHRTKNDRFYTGDERRIDLPSKPERLEKPKDRVSES